MAKRFEFKQNDLKRGVPFAIIYMIAVFIFCYIKFGGIFGMADAVDNIGSAKASGFFIGLAVLAPFFIILTMLMPKIAVEVFDDRLVFFNNKKENKTISFNDISKIQINVSNLNQMDFFDLHGSMFIKIQPQNKPEILKGIITEIGKQAKMTKQVGTKNYFGKNIETITYLMN